VALEKEFEFYQKNMMDIREKYLGKEVIIIGEQIIAAYDDIEKAYMETAKSYEPGTFMIHKVPENIEDEVVTLSPFVF